MFDFGSANPQQQNAIAASDGPVLITAGPGTGKTFTLVQRVIYLIQERGIFPENIFVATFTEKAAKELITRISNELFTRNINANINDMYVGTFHSICLRILKDFPDYTRLRKSFRLIDSFEQQYIIFQNLHRFKNISGLDSLFPGVNGWALSAQICSYVNKLSEELISPDKLINDENISIATLGKIFTAYNELITENNLIDFSAILVETYTMLKNFPDVLSKLQNKISHIMIDEYQDTNTIQEKISFLLAGENQNICVVGDDDQSLYRFRGATVRNILQFPEKFPKGKCKKFSLVVNYRSEKNIIDFYNNWMQKTSGADFKFEWQNFRFHKIITPAQNSTLESPAVVKLPPAKTFENWHDDILNFIRRLIASGKLADLNQIAFLFRSVKNDNVIALANFLESNGIKIYSPRSDLFFQREEIKFSLGCILLMFPRYIQNLDNYKFLGDKKNYYENCIMLVNDFLSQPENISLKKFLYARGVSHYNLTSTTDYAFSGLLYQLFSFKPFSDILSTKLNAGISDIRPARNLAKLTQIFGKFEYLHNIDTLNPKYIHANTEKLFNTFLRFMFDGGITEYEDASEYAPSGCVSFMTIHQAKGLEFPIVIVDSLGSVPKSDSISIMHEISEKYFTRPNFEPEDSKKFFDFWRLYYTAFSRAESLLVLTCRESSHTPSKYFREVYSSLPSVEGENFKLENFSFRPVKNISLKNTYSFTSNITVYETCPTQYKFYKELEFLPVQESAILFGSLVHETIEDIHKAAIKNETQKITPENISNWLIANYEALSKTKRSYLSKTQIHTALQHVLRYVENQRGDWHKIKQAEVDISLIKPEYIITGKIDLINGQDDTLEIIDFKSTQKPDINNPDAREKLELYRRQLHIYAHIIQERTGQKVSKMNLYYTGEKNSVPTISFPNSTTAIQGTLAAFDDTVKKILQKDFDARADDAKICHNCDFRHYCKKF